MLDLQKLASFRMVANTRSFTRAAAELGYAQSTVTAHIQSLERELGVPLFERVRFSREIEVTEPGRRALEYANRLLALANETSMAIHSQSEPVGPLRICANPLLLTCRVPAILRQYQLQHPHVHLSLSSYSDPRMLVGSVLNGVADVAFVFDEPIRSDRVVSQSLGAGELVVVCSREHPLAQATNPVEVAELAQHQALFSDEHCSIRGVFGRVLVNAGAAMERTLEVGGFEAVKVCAAATLGFAILPLFAVEREVAAGELVIVPTRGLEVDLEVQIVRNSRGWVSPAVRALWSLRHAVSSVVSAA